MIQVKEEDQKWRDMGICPHSRKRCDRAKMCLLSAPDACMLLIQNTVCSCCSCKRRGPCRKHFKCFRETKEGMRI